jgi:hypothetical protein
MLVELFFTQAAVEVAETAIKMVELKLVELEEMAAAEQVA